jgi:hypothetical protein
MSDERQENFEAEEREEDDVEAHSAPREYFLKNAPEKDDEERTRQYKLK